MKVLYILSIKIMLIRSFQAEIVRKKGKNLLSDPIFNKVISINLRPVLNQIRY